MNSIKINTAIILLMMGVLYNAIAQKLLPDTIYWDNGYATLSSDIKNVWIIKNEGAPIKNVRLKEIDYKKGKVVYEKEKCLHDLYIFNINRIQAGKYSVYAMYFCNGNVPVIKMFAIHPNPLEEYVEFPHFKLPPKSISKLPSQVKKTATDSIKIVKGVKPFVTDSLIDLQGQIILIKVIEQAPELIRFKKANNPDGPVYVIPSENIQIKQRKNNITIIQISN